MTWPLGEGSLVGVVQPCLQLGEAVAVANSSP
jgi:hypothetical protein